MVVPNALKRPVPACTHRTRLNFDVHLACFKCRVKAWGLDGMCSNEHRCTECVNEPPYVFAMVVERYVHAQRRAENRQKAKQASKHSKGGASLSASAQARKQIGDSLKRQVDEIKARKAISAPHVTPEKLRFEDPFSTPSTSTPNPYDDTYHQSFHESDLLSPPDLSFNTINSVINDMSFAEPSVQSGTTIERHGTTIAS